MVCASASTATAQRLSGTIDKRESRLRRGTSTNTVDTFLALVVKPTPLTLIVLLPNNPTNHRLSRAHHKHVASGTRALNLSRYGARYTEKNGTHGHSRP